MKSNTCRYHYYRKVATYSLMDGLAFTTPLKQANAAIKQTNNAASQVVNYASEVWITVISTYFANDHRAAEHYTAKNFRAGNGR